MTEAVTFDLAVTDLHLPVVDGVEIIGRWRSLFPTLPILALSGSGSRSEMEDLRRARLLGATEILMKPFSLAQFRSAVQICLGLAPKRGGA